MLRLTFLLFFLMSIYSIPIAKAEKIYTNNAHYFQIYDSDTDKLIKSIPWPNQNIIGYLFAVSNDGNRLYVTQRDSDQYSNFIVVVDGINFSFLQTKEFLDYGYIGRPVLAPDGKFLYVSGISNETAQYMLKINTENMEIVNNKKLSFFLQNNTSKQLYGISHDGKRLFAAEEEAGKIYVFETTHLDLVSTLKINDGHSICSISPTHDKNSLYVVSRLRSSGYGLFFSEISIYTGNILKQIEIKNIHPPIKIVISPYSERVILLPQMNYSYKYSLNIKNFSYEVAESGFLYDGSFTRDGTKIYITDYDCIRSYNPVTLNPIGERFGSTFTSTVAIAQDQFKDNTQTYSVPYNLLLD